MKKYYKQILIIVLSIVVFYCLNKLFLKIPNIREALILGFIYCLGNLCIVICIFKYQDNIADLFDKIYGWFKYLFLKFKNSDNLNNEKLLHKNYSELITDNDTPEKSDIVNTSLSENQRNYFISDSSKLLDENIRKQYANQMLSDNDIKRRDKILFYKTDADTRIIKELLNKKITSFEFLNKLTQLKKNTSAALIELYDNINQNEKQNKIVKVNTVDKISSVIDKKKPIFIDNLFKVNFLNHNKIIQLNNKNIDYSKLSKQKKLIGARGEELAYEYEIKRITDAVGELFVNNVRLVSDKNFGYDILSVSEKGEPRYIEVKTSIGGINDDFYLTQNEYEFMLQHPENYCIYRIYEYSENTNTGKLYIFENADMLNELFDFKIIKYKAKAKIS